MDLNTLLSSIVDDYDSFTEDYKDECKEKVKVWLWHFMTSAESMKQLEWAIGKL